MADRIRVGIIGSGGIAGAHANAYKQMPDVQIVAVTDVVPGRAEEFIRKFELTDARAFQDHRDLLAVPMDGVSICTPNNSHRDTTVDALQAGVHVLLEKPMSVTLEQAEDMVRAERASGKILTIGFQPRYDPNMQEMKRIVRSGVLGNVYYVQTGGGRRRGMPSGTFIRKDLAGSGALADIGCYSLDMALDALGYPKPLTVSAYASNYFGTNPLYHPEASQFEVEDFGVALIRLEGGIALNFKISWAMHMDSLGPTLFLGTDKGLKVTPAGTGPWGGIWDGGIGSMTLYEDVEGKHTDRALTVQAHTLDLFYEKVRDFVVAIRDGLPAPIPGEQILINQAIIDGILRSAALAREVTVDMKSL